MKPKHDHCVLRGLRGSSYYTGLRSHLSKVGQDMVKEAILMKPLTTLDLGKLSLKYKLNFRATCEHLEESKVLPTGIYSKLIERGVKAGAVFDAVKELQSNPPRAKAA